MKPNAYLFIDASNIWQIQKAKGYFLDYQKLLRFLLQEFNLEKIQAFYYSAYPANGTRNYDLQSKHNFFVYLKKELNIEVRKKKLKRIKIKNNGRADFQEKGNMDVEMTIDAVFFADKYDIALMFTGDSDFLSLIKHLKNRGKKIFIFSSQNNISEELRTGGDVYFDLLKILQDIWGRGIVYRK